MEGHVFGGRTRTATAKRSLMLTTALATAVLLHTPAFPQFPSASVARTNVNIPAQSLSGALVQYSNATGVQLFFNANLVRGKKAPGLRGSFTTDQAMSRMLSGTGLTYRTSGNAVTIVDPNAGGNDATATVEGAIALDTIDVSGGRDSASGSGYQGTPDWVYTTPAAVSVVSREAIENSPARNTRDLLDSVAGVYVSRAEAQQPGISVNIRGLQDQDRIVMMIDGARQSFQRNGHGATQQTYVDTAFLREIDVEKSSTSSVGSLGSLGGSVNFRTLIADDLIQPGKQWGAQVNASTGTNGFEFDGSVATAVRLSDRLSVTGGISRKKIGPYDIGKNGELHQSTTYTGNTLLFSGQEVISSLLKAEAKLTDDAKLTLGWVHNDSDFSTGYYDTLFLHGGLRETQQNVINDTFTGAFDWKPEGNLIDLHAKLYYNKTSNTDNSLVIDGNPIHYTMGTLGGSIENTSRFDTALGALSFNYGAEAFKDNGQTKMPGRIIGQGTNDNGVDITDSLNGGMPSGNRVEAGGFVNAKLEHSNWLTLQGGLRYDWYRLRGNTTIYGDRQRDLIGTIFHPGTPPLCLPSPPFPPGLCNA
ncbi:MAG: TonB-dependent receptor plug domain-containing protein, partial [Hyphomicrobiaceae bacterium]